MVIMMLASVRTTMIGVLILIGLLFYLVLLHSLDVSKRRTGGLTLPAVLTGASEKTQDRTRKADLDVANSTSTIPGIAYLPEAPPPEIIRWESEGGAITEDSDQS